MRNRNKTGHATSMPAGLAMGATISMVITLTISLLGAQLVLSGALDQDLIGYCSLAALLAGTILGAMTSFKKIRRRKLMVCLLSGCVYFCILLAITALFFSGQYDGVGISFVTVTLGSVVAALVIGGEGKRRKPRGRQK